MATLTAIAPLTDHRSVGLSDDDALRIFDLMLRTREIDERMWALNRQGKAPFVVPCRGQEAAQVGAAWALDPQKDWLFPHYRDLGLALWFGFDVDELFLMYFAKGADIISGGRQMTHHFGSQARHIASISAPLGTQIPHAVGAAYAMRLQGKTDAVTITCFGEGTSSKGDFYEACSLAALQKLPVIFLCENNGYAISVPMAKQSPVPNVADRAAAFGFPGVIVDGTDPFATYAAVRDARARGLRGEGPTLIEAKMYRLLPHTSDDNDMTYRTREEVRQAEEGEPLKRIIEYVRSRGLIADDDIAARRARMREEIAAAVAAAQAAPDPDPATVADRVYASVEEGI
jgi:2-oxoisovalerate dehydrogenase E1 component alpha subunit